MPWNGLVEPATNRFRPPAELAAALNGGGVRPDQPVIAYCGGGISAAFDLFALSLTEWSERNAPGHAGCKATSDEGPLACGHRSLPLGGIS